VNFSLCCQRPVNCCCMVIIIAVLLGHLTIVEGLIFCSCPFSKPVQQSPAKSLSQVGSFAELEKLTPKFRPSIPWIFCRGWKSPFKCSSIFNHSYLWVAVVSKHSSMSEIQTIIWEQQWLPTYYPQSSVHSALRSRLWCHKGWCLLMR